MQDDKNDHAQPKTISCIFVQLGNFKLADTECRTGFEMWCYTIKHSSQLSEKPSNFDRAVFTRVYDACEIANFDIDKRLIFERDNMTEFDYQHDLYFSREEGKAEGRAEAANAVAMNMKKDNLDVATICKYTGLTEAEVAAL